MDVPDIDRWLGDEFASLVRKHGVPGASVAVLVDGQVTTGTAGVTSLGTGAAVDAETVFQIGSITKVWTATLVMQLVDDGLLDIDRPVRDVLPALALGDAEAAATVSARHLLSHTGGFEGDIFTDTGRGDDAIERYVATLRDVPQLSPPGAAFSYNNAAFVVLGRLIEVLRGKPYDEVLLERIADPLALDRVSPSPYEAIVHRAAVGHVTGPGEQLTPASTWALARSNAPSGSTLAMTPTDLLGLVRMHLADGVAPDGTRVLSPASVAAMRERQIDLPRLTGLGTSWGLGWELTDTDAGLVLGHDGGTIGQSSFLRVVPERGVAVALLTNGGDVSGLSTAVVGHLLAALAGVVLPSPPTPPDKPQQMDVGRFLGYYADTIYDIRITQDDDGRLWLDRTPKDVIAEIGERPVRSELVHLDGDTFITVEEFDGSHLTFAFLPHPADARAPSAYVHYGRIVPRVS